MNKEEVIKRYGWVDSEYCKMFKTEHPELNFTYTWWEKIWYALYRSWGAFAYFFARKYQRVRYGFELRESWGLDYSIAKFTLPRLQMMRNNSIGYPISLKEAEWNAVLDKIIYSLEMIILDTEECLKLPEEVWDDVQKGLDLFGKHFRSLWY